MKKKLFFIGLFVFSTVIAGCSVNKIEPEEKSFFISGNQLFFQKYNNIVFRSSYFISGDSILDIESNNIVKLSDIDLKSLEIHGTSHLCDKTNCYVDLVKIEGADPKSFDVIENLLSEDDKNIYLCDKILTKKGQYKNIVGDFGSYLQSNDKVFFYLERISELPPEKWLGTPLITTKISDSGYCVGYINSLSGEMTQITGDFIKVGESVLRGGKLLSGFIYNTGNVKYIGGIFISDGENIWGRYELLTGLDINTVEYIGGNSYLKDKNGIYVGNKKISNDSLGFEVIGEGVYSRDSKNIYYLGEKINCEKDKEKHQAICESFGK